MKKLAEIADRPLVWSQPAALRMEFELRAGEDVAATLSYRSMFGSFATGRSGDGCWTFKRMGFFSTRATIRECDGDVEIAGFKNSTWHGGGTLKLPDGREYRATTNLWHTRLEFWDASDTPLIRFKSGGLIHLSAEVELMPAAAEIQEMRWILLFGWYLTVMMRMDSSGGAAAAAG